MFKNKTIRIIGILLLIISLVGIIASLFLSINHVEKIIGRELREQSKMGVSLLQTQIFNLSLILGLIALTSSLFSNDIAIFISHNKKFMQNVFLFIIVIFLLIIMGEIILRLFFADTIYNEYGLGPGYVKLTEGVSLNSLGFRDVEHSIQKGNSKRILILGDSMTYGAGIEDFEDIYSRILQKNLDETYGKNAYEVIIMSQLGWSTLDELRALHNTGLTYNPDIIILGYYLNDAEGPSSRIGFEKLYFHHYFYPYAVGGWIYKHSFFYYILESRLKNMIRHFGLEKLDYIDYINHLYDDSTDFQKIHTKTFKTLIQTANKKEIPIIVMNIPALFDTEEYPFLNAVEYVQKISLENDAYYLDLHPTLSEYESSSLRVSFLDGHINANAHKIVGETLFEFLKNESLVE